MDFTTIWLIPIGERLASTLESEICILSKYKFDETREADNCTYISIDSRLIRKIPAAYSDGVYAMAGQDRPSPRKLSDLFMQGDDGLPSVKNRTALFAFFGENNHEYLFIDQSSTATLASLLFKF